MVAQWWIQTDRRSRRAFKPEFLNRIDEVVVFRQLLREDMSAILELELSKVTGRLEAKGRRLSLTKNARVFLVNEGFNESLGARPLRRAIEKHIEDPLAEEVLRGIFDGVEVIEVTERDGKLVFRPRKPGAA